MHLFQRIYQSRLSLGNLMLKHLLSLLLVATYCVNFISSKSAHAAPTVRIEALPSSNAPSPTGTPPTTPTPNSSVISSIVTEWDESFPHELEIFSETQMTEEEFCKESPEVCTQNAPPVVIRGGGRVLPKSCEIFGSDYQKLLKALELLRELALDFGSLDIASLPNLPADDLVSFGDMTARLAACRATPNACSPKLISALEFWSNPANFSMLDIASLGGAGDGFFSIGDIVVLISKLKILVKFCDPAGLGSSPVTESCCICTYDGKDEKACQVPLACTRKADCHTGADRKCHSAGYVKCHEVVNNNPECKQKLIIPDSEINDVDFSLPKDFEKCSRILDYHFGHSAPFILPNVFPNRLRACVVGAPWCQDYRNINFGCNTFSTNGNESGVDQAADFLRGLIDEFGLDQVKILCAGNQDFSYTSYGSPDFQNCTHAYIIIDCKTDNRTIDVQYPNCDELKGKKCVGKGKKAKCLDRSVRPKRVTELTCTGNYIGGPTWK